MSRLSPAVFSAAQTNIPSPVAAGPGIVAGSRGFLKDTAGEADRTPVRRGGQIDLAGPLQARGSVLDILA